MRFDTRSRSAAKANAVTEPVKRAPARKDTRRWCRGKEGREHRLVLVLRHDGFCDRRCEWVSWYDYRLLFRGEDDEGARVGWACSHQEVCESCGKIIRDLFQIPAAECPAYPGTVEQRRAAEREAAAYPAQWRAWAARHGRWRPVITGPQHYRRKREDEAS
jgi:hypothetical protein